MAAAMNVVHQPVQRFVAGNIERRNQDDLVVGEVGAVRKNKIHSNILTVQGFVHLPQDGAVVDLVAELHELDTVMRVAAVEDGNLAGAFQVNDFGSNAL